MNKAAVIDGLGQKRQRRYIHREGIYTLLATVKPVLR